MTTRLHGVCHAGEVTAVGALAWFAGQPAGREVIGYLLAPDRAEWFRCDGPVARGPDGPRDLATAFEVFATDGQCQLRWTHGARGTGRAVSLAEDPDLLPPGENLPAEPERTRLAHPVKRLLAGNITRSRDDWATLASARYGAYEVPVTGQPRQQVWANLAEYVVCDVHGNLSVIDTLLLSLRAVEPAGGQSGAAKEGSA